MHSVLLRHLLAQIFLWWNNYSSSDDSYEATKLQTVLSCMNSVFMLCINVCLINQSVAVT